MFLNGRLAGGSFHFDPRPIGPVITVGLSRAAGEMQDLTRHRLIRDDGVLPAAIGGGADPVEHSVENHAQPAGRLQTSDAKLHPLRPVPPTFTGAGRDTTNPL